MSNIHPPVRQSHQDDAPNSAWLLETIPTQSQLHGVVSKPKSFDLVKLLCLPSPFQNTPHAHKYHTYIPVGSLKFLPLHLPTVCIGTQTQLFHFKQTSPVVLHMMHHTPSRNKDGFAMTPPPSFTNAQRPSSVREMLSNYKLLHDPCRETETFDVDDKVPQTVHAPCPVQHIREGMHVSVPFLTWALGFA